MCLRPYLNRVEASVKRLEPFGKRPGAPCMLLGTAKSHTLAAHIFKKSALNPHASTTLFEGVLCVLETVFELC